MSDFGYFILPVYQHPKPGKQIIRAGHYPSRGLVKAEKLLTCNPQSVKVQRRPRKARGGLAQRATTFRLSDPLGMNRRISVTKLPIVLVQP